jgi:SAM-dependent methyltransferase
VVTDAFAGRAEVYAQGRLDCADRAVEFLYGLVAADSPRIADIGAGTGKLTAQLARRPGEVWAVEPDPDMRAQAEAGLAGLGNVHIVAGTAEATTLRAHSVDLVVCAQAFHWFDPVAFRAECERIGPAPVAILYNSPSRRRHAELSWWNPWHQAPRWEDRQGAIREFFGQPLTRVEFPHPLRYAHDEFLASMMSHSTTPRADDPAYERYRESVEAIFAREAQDGVLAVDNVTFVYWGG